MKMIWEETSVRIVNNEKKDIHKKSWLTIFATVNLEAVIREVHNADYTDNDRIVLTCKMVKDCDITDIFKIAATETDQLYLLEKRFLCEQMKETIKRYGHKIEQYEAAIKNKNNQIKWRMRNEESDIDEWWN